MDKLRLFLIQEDYLLKLTAEESKNGGAKSYQNSSWLMQDRGDFKHTHSEYPGPFTKENVKKRHIYCSLETWVALGKLPNYHWDYRNKDNYYSYNPPDDSDLPECCMCLSITQRKKVWLLLDIHLEIFDDLLPYYRELLN